GPILRRPRRGAGASRRKASMTDEISELIHWQTIPAFPGYFLWGVQDASEKGCKELVDREPIIGWLVEQRRMATKEKYYWWGKPLVATTYDTDEYTYAIELPDGKIWFPEERMCGSFEEACEYL